MLNTTLGTALAPHAKTPEEAGAVTAFWREAELAMWFAKDPDFD